MLLDTLQRANLRAADQVEWTPTSALDPYWYSPVGEFSQTFAGFPIGPETALRVSAVFACNSLIAETLASLPCILHRRLGGGRKERARDDRRYKLLRHRPNSWQTRIDFFAGGQLQLGLKGAAFARVRDDGKKVELIPMRPDFVRVEQLPPGEQWAFRYEYTDPNTLRTETLLQDEVLHVRDLSMDGFTGLARASLAREAIAVAAAGEAFAGGYFKNDATGRLVFQHPAHLDEKKREEFEDMIRDKWAGWQNRSKAMLLWGGVEAKEIGGFDSDKNFIIDPRRFQVSDIARFWRVPGFLIGLEEKSTSFGTGIGQQKEGFVTFTMRTWADRWATALEQVLLTEEEREEFFIEFLFDDLLRGELKNRVDAYRTMKEIGAINPNEIRERENMNPREDEGGDEYQDTTTGAAPNAPRSESRPVEEEEGAAARVLLPTPLLMDAANRIAKEDVRAVNRRAAKACDEPDMWRVWVVKHYDSHRDYVLRVLAPLAAAYHIPVGIVGVVVEDVVASGRKALADGVPDDWAATRTAEVIEILERTFDPAVLEAVV